MISLVARSLIVAGVLILVLSLTSLKFHPAKREFC